MTSATHAQSWQAELDWLFRLRDAAVHFRSVSQPTAPHALGRTHVAQELIDYSPENATRAVELVFAVLSQCVAAPKSRHRDLARRMAEAQNIMPTLRQWRA